MFRHIKDLIIKPVDLSIDNYYDYLREHKLFCFLFFYRYHLILFDEIIESFSLNSIIPVSQYIELFDDYINNFEREIIIDNLIEFLLNNKNNNYNFDKCRSLIIGQIQLLKDRHVAQNYIRKLTYLHVLHNWSE